MKTALIVALASITLAQTPPRLTLELAEYARMPITGALDGVNTLGQLSRVNFLRDEPGGRRFFVSDLNGQLYILDKQTKAFATYLNFNGADTAPGLFPRFTLVPGFASGLINVQFDPDYARNGVFYTIHLENHTLPAAAAPKTGVVSGLNLSSYTTTAAAVTPTSAVPIEREAVLIEWTDRDTKNTTFEGTARELLRLQQNVRIHPFGEMTFNPVARAGSPEWRVLYLGVGDTGSGEQRDSRSLNPQRLDTLVGKILRIVPDLGEHVATSTVSENGRYRIPNDNPFVATEGARKEIWALGLRNPHRLSWDVDPSRPTEPRLFAFNIGLSTWEMVNIIKKGANYGWPLREGNQVRTATGFEAPSQDDTVPVRISDTVVRGTITPTYPVIQYPHAKETGGDAIAGGFVYRGKKLAALQGKLVFGDMTTGRLWHASLADVLAADDGKAETMAQAYEVEWSLKSVVEEVYRTRGGKGAALPGSGAVSGPGRVDFRFALDNDGEIYILTKPDGVIRQVVGVK